MWRPKFYEGIAIQRERVLLDPGVDRRVVVLVKEDRAFALAIFLLNNGPQGAVRDTAPRGDFVAGDGTCGPLLQEEARAKARSQLRRDLPSSTLRPKRAPAAGSP